MKLKFPIKLPLIEKIAQQIDLNGQENLYLFGVQHLAYTTAEMFKALIARGFPANNIFLHGKCYSTNPYAVEMLKKLGVHIAPQSATFNSHIEYDKQFPHFVKEFFYPLINEAKGKKIILDDGAELLKLVIASNHNDNVVAIEQTSAGYHRAKSQILPFPIINVARSATKLIQESSFITRMICRKIKEAISSFKPQGSDLKILIIGGGAIGNGVRSYLSSEYHVELFDLSEALSDFPKEAFDHRLSQYDVIIGCTGNCSIPQEKHSLIKPNTLLISASSSDREFDSVMLRKKIPVYFDCHKTVVCQDLILVNSGFPVNFDRTFLDSTEFQLTRALLLTAIHQAIETRPSSEENVFVSLKNSEEISKQYKELLSSQEFSSKKGSEIEFI